MILDRAVDIVLPDADSFPNLERVVASFDDVDIGGGVERRNDRAQFVGGFQRRRANLERTASAP